MSTSNLWNVAPPARTSGLLLTVLGEFVRPSTGPGGSAPEGVWTQTLVEVLGAVGVREKAARQSIARLHERHWLTKQAVGRQTRWSLTPWAIDLLSEGADRIYHFGQHGGQRGGQQAQQQAQFADKAQPSESDNAPSDWTGQWIVVLASLPEAESRTRYRLTTRLRWIGLGTIGQGIWISPRVDRVEEVQRVLRDLGMASSPVFVAELTDQGEPMELAARAWDLPRLAGEYEDFIRTFERLPSGPVPDPDVDPLADLLSLVHRWRYFPSIDPDLPPALLPADFPAATAASLFAVRRADLLGPAWDRWHAIDGAYHPQSKAS